MTIPKTDEPIILTYFYKELEPDEYYCTKKQIASFIEAQSQTYHETLVKIIKENKIPYMSNLLDCAIKHFEEILDEAIMYSTLLEVRICPEDRSAEYRIEEEIVYLDILDNCPWKDFILYGELSVASDSTDPVINISTEFPDTLAHFKVKKESINLSLLNSGIFKDFLIGANLELTAEQGKLVIAGKEHCF